jgi:hypothetical protein
MVSAGSGSGDYLLTMLKPQERTMAAFIPNAAETSLVVFSHRGH